MAILLRGFVFIQSLLLSQVICEVSISSVVHGSGSTWSQGIAPIGGKITKDSSSNVDISGSLILTNRGINLSGSSSLNIALGASVQSAAAVNLVNSNVQLSSPTSSMTLDPLSSFYATNVDVYIGSALSAITVRRRSVITAGPQTQGYGPKAEIRFRQGAKMVMGEASSAIMTGMDLLVDGTAGNIKLNDYSSMNLAALSTVQILSCSLTIGKGASFQVGNSNGGLALVSSVTISQHVTLGNNAKLIVAGGARCTVIQPITVAAYQTMTLTQSTFSSAVVCF